jgi:hypothetical protein
MIFSPYATCLVTAVSVKVPWRDYVEFTWAQTGKQVLEEMENPWSFNVSDTWNLGDADGMDKSRPTLFLNSALSNQGRQHFLQLEEFSNRDQPGEFFVWQIGADFWGLDLWMWYLDESRQMLSIRPSTFPDGIPYWRKGCSYYASSIPWRVQAVSDLVFQEVQSLADDSTTGIFHIRRG